VIARLLRYLFGCTFEHAGKWGAPVDEDWHKTDRYTGQQIPDSGFIRHRQTRACVDCGAAEERYVS
jgi:hypothetical protein